MRPVRRGNRALILRRIAEHGPRSRTTLALETGLDKSTVSNLVAELIGAGLLRERPARARHGAVGRPRQDLEIEPDGPFVLGLEVNVDYLAAWTADLGGGVRHRGFAASDNRAAAPDQVLGRLADLAQQAVERSRVHGGAPLAATVAVPGLVDVRGSVVVAPNLGWTDVAVADLLPAELGARVENEANLGAVAELVEGAGRGLRDFVYVSGEIGIGAGIVLGGELFRGASGFAGEFGHLTIDPGGPPCGCGGRGCLERLAGQDALLRLAGWDARMRSSGSPPDWPGAMLADSARSGDPKTLGALGQVGHTLGNAIASLANLLDPEAVLLGGYFAPLAESLRGPIQVELSARALGGRRMRCRVLAAQLGGDAAVRGALGVSRRAALELAAAAPAAA